MDGFRNLPRLRSLISRLLLVLLIAVFAASFPYRTLAQGLARRAKLFEPRNYPQIDASGFWFDPAYAPFLEAIRKSTPENATVALIAPTTIDLYVYQAAYGLIPRRIVGEPDLSQASFIAVYKKPVPRGLPQGSAIPGGVLICR